jgi:hypothetical protein
MNEKMWVNGLVPRLANELDGFEPSEIKIAASDGSKLAYSCVIQVQREAIRRLRWRKAYGFS